MALVNGLTLSKEYFEAYGRPMLEQQFPELLPYLAAGLAGSGSECFGFDDAVSQDHDFEPGFCLFLPGEDVIDRKTAFLLERAYAKLPKEFMGFRRAMIQPAGGPRHGVLRTADFFRDKTGTPDGVLTISEWMNIPQQSLAESVNGEIYFDSFGEVTAIRSRLRFYPGDIFRKKLAGHLMLLAQAGRYNYPRCIRHGETGAAQLAVYEFVDHAAGIIFLLNHRYRPFYKWMFRALRTLPRLSLNAELMEYLLTTDNSEAMAEEKLKVMEGMTADLIAELVRQGLSAAVCGDPEKHAASVNDSISDPGLRNAHILAAV